MRPRYLVVVVAAVALALLAAPAEAAMPKSKPTETRVCPNNPKKKLRLWAKKDLFAVDNPCRDWFSMSHHPGGESSDSASQGVLVAGFSKVNLDIDLTTRDWGWRLTRTPSFCNHPESGTVAYYGDGHELTLGDLGCEFDF